MGIIVRILGGGLGLASEAIHDFRSSTRSKSGQPPSPNPTDSSSRAIPPNSDAPPEYVEVADEATAEKMIRSGKVERVVDYADEKKGFKSKSAEAGYDNEDDDSSTDNEDSAAGDDEAAWELDEMAERVAPPAYADTEAEVTATTGATSEEDIAKKEDRTIRELVRMAGPPPQPIQKLPCPVIIPQRRPGTKDRGFVRAYAPVMEGCGVGQDVFLKLQTEWYAASKVRCPTPIPTDTYQV